MIRFYVGIDVGKVGQQVAIIDHDGKPRGKSFSVLNSAEAFAALAARLQDLAPQEEILLGMEATGAYGWPLHHYLLTQGFRVLVLNPFQTEAFAKARIRRTKTDPIDALGIAQLLRFGQVSVAIIPDERSLRLRELTRYRTAVLRLLVRFSNLLTSRVARTFPELVRCFPGGWSASALGLLEKYPVPRDIAPLPVADLAKELRSLSHGQLGVAKAEQVSKAAQNTVGLPKAADVYALEIRGIVGVLRLLHAHLQEVTQHVSKVLREVPQPLTSIPGIADLTAASILGEIVDVRLFKHPRKLVAFAGFDPSIFQSGRFTGDQSHISKRGSTHLRRTLWQAAFAAIRFNRELRAYYRKKVGQGKHHKTALGAVCRKLLHLIWRILTDNRTYEDRAPQA